MLVAVAAEPESATEASDAVLAVRPNAGFAVPIETCSGVLCVRISKKSCWGLTSSSRWTTTVSRRRCDATRPERI
jgi:hypothetical protein